MSLYMKRLEGDVRAQRNLSARASSHLQTWGYLITGLAGEVGEFAGEVKKQVRDPNAEINTDNAFDELADVLWYVEACAQHLGVTLEQLAEHVVAKLEKRRRNLDIVTKGEAP